MIRKTWHQALCGLALIGTMTLAACGGGGPTATPAAQPGAQITATSSVAMPNVNSDANVTGGAQPVPQPGLSPTGGQSPIGGQAFAAGDVKAVEITTADGVVLTGTFYAPNAAGKPAVVMLHMVGGQRGDWDTLARQLQAAGFAALTVDLRGHGGSQGERDWGKMTADAAAAFAWLSSRSEADPTRIGFIGASIGANLSLNFAATQPAVKAVALLSPGLDFQGVKTEGAIVTYGPRPLLLIASSEDTESASAVVTLDKLALGKRTVKMYEGQGHGTRMLGRQNGVEELILDWLRSAFN